MSRMVNPSCPAMIPGEGAGIANRPSRRVSPSVDTTPSVSAIAASRAAALHRRVSEEIGSAPLSAAGWIITLPRPTMVAPIP